MMTNITTSLKWQEDVLSLLTEPKAGPVYVWTVESEDNSELKTRFISRNSPLRDSINSSDPVLHGAGGNFDEEGGEPSGRDQGCISEFFLCNLTDFWIPNHSAGELKPFKIQTQ